MTQYLLRRLIQAVIVVLGVTALAFGVLFLTGDPVYLLVDPRGATQEQIQQLRVRFGFDQPVPVQYVRYIGNALRGDFGLSLHHGVPNWDLIVQRLPATLELAFAGFVIALAVAIPAGIVAATRRNTWADYASMNAALLGQSMPVFWLGILLILVFSVSLGWLPVSGRGGIEHLILPAITVGAFTAARTARMVRSTLLEVLGQDYVRTARAKGAGERRVVLRHGLRNALIPVVTLLGIDFGYLLGGAVITETIFAWPGAGRLAVQAITNKDIPLVQSIVILMALLFVVINLLVDVLYTLLDPRVRLA
ncbi:MAG: ABC transporter permease [Armatimonadetes bacterium]|nr:ABC transporter permease [Armatimonadota bacterium]